MRVHILAQRALGDRRTHEGFEFPPRGSRIVQKVPPERRIGEVDLHLGEVIADVRAAIAFAAASAQEGLPVAPAHVR